MYLLEMRMHDFLNAQGNGHADLLRTAGLTTTCMKCAWWDKRLPERERYRCHTSTRCPDYLLSHKIKITMWENYFEVCR